jgi:hypothetical protein
VEVFAQLTGGDSVLHVDTDATPSMLAERSVEAGPAGTFIATARLSFYDSNKHHTLPANQPVAVRHQSPRRRRLPPVLELPPRLYHLHLAEQPPNAVHDPRAVVARLEVKDGGGPGAPSPGTVFLR